MHPVSALGGQRLELVPLAKGDDGLHAVQEVPCMLLNDLPLVQDLAARVLVGLSPNHCESADSVHFNLYVADEVQRSLSDLSHLLGSQDQASLLMEVLKNLGDVLVEQQMHLVDFGLLL